MKYELLQDQTIEYKGQTLYRIRALKDIPNRSYAPTIKAGTLGGYVSGEHNLSQQGDSWVYYGAAVYRQAVVKDNAIVTGRARVGGYSTVMEDAEVGGEAGVTGSCVVRGSASVLGRSRMHGNSVVQGSPKLLGTFHMTGNAVVQGSCEYHFNASLSDHAFISSPNDLFVTYVVGEQARPLCFYSDKDGNLRTIWDGVRGGFLDDYLAYLDDYHPELYEEHLLLVESAELRHKRLRGEE